MNVTTEDDPDQLSNNATTTSSPTFFTTMSPTAAPFRTVSLSDDRTTAAPFFDSRSTTSASPSTAPSFLFGGTTSNSTGTTNQAGPTTSDTQNNDTTSSGGTTTTSSTTTILWPLIVLILLVLLLAALLVAIHMLSVRQKKINRQFRHRLNGFILLIAIALSIGAHVSCNTWSLVVGGSAAGGGEFDEIRTGEDLDWSDIRAIGIWGVWDDNESWCRYRRSTSRHETMARTLAVLATIMGAVSYVCWMNSQYDSKPKSLASLAVLFGIAAASAEGGALTALYRSLPCGNDIDDLLVACTLWGSYQTATLGGVWPILAIVYWAAGLVVILWTVLVLGDDAIRESSLNDNDD
jgi:hypothetical protein